MKCGVAEVRKIAVQDSVSWCREMVIVHLGRARIRDRCGQSRPQDVRVWSNFCKTHMPACTFCVRVHLEVGVTAGVGSRGRYLFLFACSSSAFPGVVRCVCITWNEPSERKALLCLPSASGLLTLLGDVAASSARRGEGQCTNKRRGLIHFFTRLLKWPFIVENFKPTQK